MSQSSVSESVSTTTTTAGIDLGDRKSSCCVLDPQGRVLERLEFPMTARGLERHGKRLHRLGVGQVALEVGTHSPWVSHALEGMGFEVYVANARKLHLIAKNVRKTDRVDAEILARLARVDPKLLSPIKHRGPRARADRSLLKSRDALVESRTQLINHVRNCVKSWGARLPSCSSASFHKKTRELIPEPLQEALWAVVDSIEQLTETIAALTRRLESLGKERYPETALLQQVRGVGPLTALSFVLTLESPERIDKARNVGAYLGLVPRESQSGNRKPELRITKNGDRALRSLLVCCAHYIMGPFGEDSDLKRFGERIAARGDKAAKKRAVVAVARKLSVLLLRLWQTGERYDPLRNSHRTSGRASGVEAPDVDQILTAV